MSEKSKQTITLNELEPGSPFKFNGDKTRTTYWFKQLDGKHAQIFSSLRDMNKFNNPSFVDSGTIIEELEEVLSN